MSLTHLEDLMPLMYKFLRFILDFLCLYLRIASFFGYLTSLTANGRLLARTKTKMRFQRYVL